MTWNIFKSRQPLVAELSDVISKHLEREISRKGLASWAVSGGSTPEPLFAAIQKIPMAWPKVQIALVDERWVDRDHPRSNEAFVQASLCQGLAAAASFVGMKTADGDPFVAEAEVNERYQGLSLPFDSVLLGMGPDGHTASLFPDAKNLQAAMDPKQSKTCIALAAQRSEVTGDEVLRMSLTASAIAAARQCILMITGAEKKQLLEEAISNDLPLPITRLMHQCVVDIYWAP